QFPGVIPGLLENRISIAEDPPVEATHEYFRKIEVNLADHLLEMIATVGIHDHEFFDAVKSQNLQYIPEDHDLGRGIHIHTKRDIDLARIHPKRDAGQNDGLGSMIPRFPG